MSARLGESAGQRVQRLATQTVEVGGRVGSVPEEGQWTSLAVNAQRVTISLGCAGMRTFTEIASDRMLGVIPAPMIEALVEAVERTVTQNETMEVFYSAHKAAVNG